MVLEEIGSVPTDEKTLYETMSTNKCRTDKIEENHHFNLNKIIDSEQDHQMNVKTIKKKRKKEKDQSTFVSVSFHSLALEQFQLPAAPTILLKLKCLKDNGDF